MTTPDIAGLCLELFLTSTMPGSLSSRAADTLERQAAEIERLRDSLDFAISCLCSLRKNYAEDLGIWDDVDKAINSRGDLNHTESLC